jgi:ribosomal protein S18 acetylase RimI-like enzyme
MHIEPFRIDDIGRFLELAAFERWVAEPWEFEFLLSAFPHGCFCVRDEAGTASGFVTSLKHGNSGWIGNLIVAPELRGRGGGEALFVRACDALRAAGAETVWLTASKMGRSLYEKHGFTTTDTIVRWHGAGGGTGHPAAALTGPPDGDIDRLGWGDRRGNLLAMTGGRGTGLASSFAFAVVQPCGAALQVGPFGAVEPAEAARLFDEARSLAQQGTMIYIDAPAGNRHAAHLFQRRGFLDLGVNDLMYAGKRPDYRPEYIYGLATMGSCG